MANRLPGFLVVGLSLGFAACGGESLTIPPSTGNLQITTTTVGSDVDPDGYTLQVDALQPQTIGATATVSVEQLTPGAHNVVLTGLAGNCSVAGDNPRSVTIAVGQTTTAAFDVNCGGTTGSLEITAQTNGPSPDADGYAVSLDGTDRGSIGANAVLTLSNLPPGSHVVGLTGVAANCQVDGDNLRVVTIVAQATATLTFAVTCVQPPPVVGVLRITTTTTGPGQDENGYQFAVDGAEPQVIGVNATTDLANTAVGLHSVVLSNVASNCTVDDASKSATVLSGVTVTVAFNITCGATTGSIRVATTTTGENLDDGYQFAIDGGAPQSIVANGDQTVGGMAAGSHTVVLSGVATNCSVDAASKSATVTSGATATVAFNITCGTTTGSIRVATSTTGENLDDGYQFAIDGGSPQAIVANGDQTVGGFAPGSHTVVLSGIAGNCNGDASKNVSVTAGETSDVNFSITCTSTTPSASKSEISANPKDIDAGTESSTIRVTVKNDGGKVLGGVNVTPNSSGSGNTFTPTSATTGTDGVATFAFSSTVAEDKTITASAGGVPLTHTETVTVSARPTTAEITSVAPEPSTAPESIHVTFTVTPQGGGSPTGTVTVFSQEEAAGCTVPVSQGSCDFALTVVGTHHLVAAYSGDSQFLDDSSDPVDHVVQ
jgi:Big-like domain-containing protein